MANYSVVNTTLNSSTPSGNAQASLTANNYFTLIATWASTVGNGTTATVLRRGKLYDILVGTNGTPGDTALEYTVRRAQIGSTVAPQLAGGISSISSAFCLDLADNPSGAATQIFINSSVTGMANTQYNGSVWYVGINQRASYRWVAAPGSELVWPAVSSATTSGNGFTGDARSASYTGTCTMNWMFQEQ